MHHSLIRCVYYCLDWNNILLDGPTYSMDYPASSMAFVAPCPIFKMACAPSRPASNLALVSYDPVHKTAYTLNAPYLVPQSTWLLDHNEA
jgi:hypothetical protein